MRESFVSTIDIRGHSDQDGSYYLDAQSITRPSKNSIRVWHKTVRKQGEGEFSYKLYLTEINCADKKYRGLSGIGYSKEGQSSTLFSTPTEWIYIPPESMGEALYKAVCK